MSLPKLTIVTPCLNSRDYIKATIDSVLGQKYPLLEYWIFDAGSTDGTLDVIRSYGDHINLVVERDRGQSDAINKGLRRANGEIVSWINSNDVYLPGAFQRVAEYFGNHPDVGLVFGDARLLSEQNQDMGGYERGNTSDMLRLNTVGSGHFEMLLNTHSGWIPQQTAFWRSRIMEEAGYLDENLHYAMDYEYWLRLGRLTTIHFIEAPLGSFRLHHDAKSTSAWKQWKEVLSINRRYGGKLFSRLHRRFMRACIHAVRKRFGVVRGEE